MQVRSAGMINGSRHSFVLPGIGLRGQHVEEVLTRRPDIAWFEVHAENYMHDPIALASLTQVRDRYPLSLHGVAMSLGSAGPLDRDHLARLKQLVEALDPFLVSEHMAWSANDGAHLNDLLPLPCTEEALDVMTAHVDEVQGALGRTILVENPSGYLRFRHSTMSEAEFLAELVRRTGCGLLCDVNNIYVSAQNIETDPIEYLDLLPAASVGEIHLAGHAVNTIGNRTILIDDHASRVSDGVWALYREARIRFGGLPTLIEWDADLPALDTLLLEAAQVRDVATTVSEEFHAGTT
jgi:uncharacterized protein (UPF0276 family)